MGFKINIRGYEVTASSAAELAALIREFPAENQPRKPGRPRVILNLKSRRHSQSPEEKMTIAFLSALATAGPKGTSTETIMPILNVKAGRGVGGRCAKINNLLSKIGFPDSDEIYTNPRLAEGRVWRPGPRIQEALEKLNNGR